MDKTAAPTGETLDTRPGKSDDLKWIYGQKKEWALADLMSASRDLRLNPMLTLTTRERNMLELAKRDIEWILERTAKHAT